MRGTEPRICNIRVEARSGKGAGHLSRMAVVARALREREIDVHFWVENPEALRVFGERWDFPYRTVSSLDDSEFIDSPKGRGVYLIDHYELPDELHHRAARRHGAQLVDFASQIRGHRLTIFPNLYAREATVRGEALLGPDDYPIAEPFRTVDAGPRETDRDVLSVYLTLGWQSPSDWYAEVLRGMLDIDRRLCVRIALGEATLAGDLASVTRALRERGHTVDARSNEEEPWKIMVSCDCAITNGGVSSYELATVGIPAAYVLVAENQRQNVEAFERQGWGPFLGDPRTGAGSFRENVRRFVKSREPLVERAPRIDGRGADRIADRITGMEAPELK